MGLSNPGGGGERKPRPIIPAGPQPAILYGIIDLGTHKEVTQWGEKKNPKIMFLWEYPFLPEHVFDDTKGAQRQAQVQEYNFFSDEKSNIVKALKSWRGVQSINMQADLPVYLGKGCQLMIEHKPSKKYPGETTCKIMGNGAIILPPNGDYGQAKNPLVLFDMDKFSWQSFHSIPQWIQNKIKQCIEWQTIIQRFGAEPQQQTQQQQVQNTQQVQYQQPQQQIQYQQPVQQQMQQANYQQVQHQQPVQQPVQQQVQGTPFQNPQQGQMNTQQFQPTTVPQPNQIPQGTGITVGNDNLPPAF